MCFFFTRRVFIIEFQRDETGGLDSGMLLAGGIWWENVVFQPDCVPGKWVSKTQRKLPHPGMFTSDSQRNLKCGTRFRLREKEWFRTWQMREGGGTSEAREYPSCETSSYMTTSWRPWTCLLNILKTVSFHSFSCALDSSLFNESHWENSILFYTDHKLISSHRLLFKKLYFKNR